MNAKTMSIQRSLERRELEGEIARLKRVNKLLRNAVLRLARDGDITISKANELLGNSSLAETRRAVLSRPR